MADKFVDPYKNYFTEEKYEILKKELDKINKKKLENNIDESDLKLFDNIYDKIIADIIKDVELNTPNNNQLLLKFSNLYMDYLDLKNTILNKQKEEGFKSLFVYDFELSKIDRIKKRIDRIKKKVDMILQTDALKKVEEREQTLGETRETDEEKKKVDALKTVEEREQTLGETRETDEEKKKVEYIMQNFTKNFFERNIEEEIDVLLIKKSIIEISNNFNNKINFINNKLIDSDFKKFCDLFLYESQIPLNYGDTDIHSLFIAKKYIFGLEQKYEEKFIKNDGLKNLLLYNKILSDSDYSEFTDIIQNTLSINEINEKNISTLFVNKFTLLNVSFSSHATGIFIEKIEDNKLNIYILNSGLGSVNHESTISLNNNRLLLPSIMKINNINNEDFKDFIITFQKSVLFINYNDYYNIIKIFFHEKKIDYYNFYEQNSNNCSIYRYFLALIAFIKIKKNKHDIDMMDRIITIFRYIIFYIYFIINVKNDYMTDNKYDKYYELYTFNNKLYNIIKKLYTDPDEKNNLIWENINKYILYELKQFKFNQRYVLNYKKKEENSLEIKKSDTHIDINDINTNLENILSSIKKSTEINDYSDVFDKTLDYIIILTKLNICDFYFNIYVYCLYHVLGKSFIKYKEELIDTIFTIPDINKISKIYDILKKQYSIISTSYDILLYFRTILLILFGWLHTWKNLKIDTKSINIKNNNIIYQSNFLSNLHFNSKNDKLVINLINFFNDKNMNYIFFNIEANNGFEILDFGESDERYDYNDVYKIKDIYLFKLFNLITNIKIYDCSDKDKFFDNFSFECNRINIKTLITSDVKKTYTKSINFYNKIISILNNDIINNDTIIPIITNITPNIKEFTTDKTIKNLSDFTFKLNDIYNFVSLYNSFRDKLTYDILENNFLQNIKIKNYNNCIFVAILIFEYYYDNEENMSKFKLLLDKYKNLDIMIELILDVINKNITDNIIYYITVYLQLSNSNTPIDNDTNANIFYKNIKYYLYLLFKITDFIMNYDTTTKKIKINIKDISVIYDKIFMNKKVCLIKNNIKLLNYDRINSNLFDFVSDEMRQKCVISYIGNKHVTNGDFYFYYYNDNYYGFSYKNFMRYSPIIEPTKEQINIYYGLLDEKNDIRTGYNYIDLSVTRMPIKIDDDNLNIDSTKTIILNYQQKIYKLIKFYDIIKNNIVNTLYQQIYKLFRFYIIFNNIELLIFNNTNEYILLTSNLEYKILVIPIITDDNITNMNIKIVYNNIIIAQTDDYYLKSENIEKNTLRYIQNTPNILINNNQIFYISQFTHHYITINNNIGIIYVEPTEDTLLYLLDCLSNNMYYNLINVLNVTISYLEKTLLDKISFNKFINKYKNNLYQITEAIIHNNPYLSYYLYRLDKYFNHKERSCYYILSVDYSSTIIDKLNIIHTLNTTMLDIYFTSEKKIKFQIIKLILIPEECKNTIKKIKTDSRDSDYFIEIKSILEKYTLINQESSRIKNEIIELLIESNNKFIDKKVKINNYVSRNIRSNITNEEYLKNIIKQELEKLSLIINKYDNIFPDLFTNLCLIDNDDMYDITISSNTINVINNILNIKNELVEQGLVFNIESISNIQIEPIWINDINDIYKSYSIFELLSGYFIRQKQEEIKNSIYSSIFGREKEIFQFLMGSGKTTVIAPLLTLDLIREKYDRNIYHVMPESLVLSSYLLNMKLLSIMYNNINVIENKEKIIEDDIEFTKINIVSDNFIKNYKISKVKKNDFWKTDIENNIFIYDEVDDILNPLSNQLNIINCELSEEENRDLKYIMKVICDFIFELYNLEKTEKSLYNTIFNSENFYNIINFNEYKNLFKIIIKKMLTTDTYRNIREDVTIIGINIDDFINNSISNQKDVHNNYKHFYEENQQLSKFSDIIYNIYLNTQTAFKQLKNVNYGLTKEDITNINYITNISNYIALPYSAIDTPIYGSEFSNIYQKIIFTISSYLNRDDTFIIKNGDIYRYLYKNIYKEYIDFEKESISDYCEYTKFNDLFVNYENKREIPLIDDIVQLNIKENVIEYLKKNIFNNKTNLTAYIVDIFNDFIKIYKLLYNISSYDLLLSGFCKNRTGFTGTPLLHKPLEPTDNFKDIKINQKDVNDIRTAITNKTIGTYEYEITNSMDIKSIIQIIKEHEYSVLIDTGAFFRDSINTLINELYDNLIDNPTKKFDCIVFIDGSHKKKIMYKNKENKRKIIDYSLKTNIPNLDNLKNRFHLFDHKHIIGQDFKIYKNAFGLITSRHDTRLRDLSQGIYRLRNINNGQSVKIILLETDINLIKIKKQTDKLDLDLLYDLLVENDTDFINSSKKLFIRQNLLALIRLLLEKQIKAYDLISISDMCNDINSIFKYNIYTLINYNNTITKQTFKKDIEDIILDILIKYISENEIKNKEFINTILEKIDRNINNVIITINIEQITDIEQQIQKEIVKQQFINNYDLLVYSYMFTRETFLDTELMLDIFNTIENNEIFFDNNKLNNKLCNINEKKLLNTIVGYIIIKNNNSLYIGLFNLLELQTICNSLNILPTNQIQFNIYLTNNYLLVNKNLDIDKNTLLFINSYINMNYKEKTFIYDNILFYVNYINKLYKFYNNQIELTSLFNLIKNYDNKKLIIIFLKIFNENDYKKVITHKFSNNDKINKIYLEIIVRLVKYIINDTKITINDKLDKVIYQLIYGTLSTQNIIDIKYTPNEEIINIFTKYTEYIQEYKLNYNILDILKNEMFMARLKIERKEREEREEREREERERELQKVREATEREERERKEREEREEKEEREKKERERKEREEREKKEREEREKKERERKEREEREKKERERERIDREERERERIERERIERERIERERIDREERERERIEKERIERERIEREEKNNPKRLTRSNAIIKSKEQIAKEKKDELLKKYDTLVIKYDEKNKEYQTIMSLKRRQLKITSVQEEQFVKLRDELAKLYTEIEDLKRDIHAIDPKILLGGNKNDILLKLFCNN
jgi:hypothetical protein